MSKISVQGRKLRLIDELFTRRRLAIVQFQRRFVWNRKKVCKLCDSIANQYPIGAFLIWKTPYSKNKHIRTQTGTIPEFDVDRNSNILFILDGQQRITTLYCVLYGKKLANYYGVEIDFKKICLNLRGKSDWNFTYCDEDENHVSLHQILDMRLNGTTRGILQRKYGTRKFKWINDCYNIFRRYIYAFVTIDAHDYDHVNEAFIRINSAGTPLSTADRLFSMITSFSFRHDVEHLKASLSQESFKSLKDENLIQGIVLNMNAAGFTGLSRDRIIRKINDKNSLENKEYLSNRDNIFRAMRKAVDYIVGQLEIPSYEFLPFPLMIPVLSVFFYRNRGKTPNSRQNREIKKWFWQTAVTPQSYSGGGYTKNVMADVRFMGRLTDHQSLNYMGNDYGKLNIRDLYSAYARGKSGLNKALHCLMAIKKPRYFENNNFISLRESSDSSNRKNLHHIFPKALLKKHEFRQRDYNNLMNLCFLPFSTNIDFMDNWPKVYLSPFRNKRHFKTIMESHILPYKSSSNIWTTNARDRFKLFLKERAFLIAREFNCVAGKDIFNMRSDS